MSKLRNSIDSIIEADPKILAFKRGTKKSTAIGGTEDVETSIAAGLVSTSIDDSTIFFVDKLIAAMQSAQKVQLLLLTTVCINQEALVKILANSVGQETVVEALNLLKRRVGSELLIRTLASDTAAMLNNAIQRGGPSL